MTTREIFEDNLDGLMDIVKYKLGSTYSPEVVAAMIKVAWEATTQYNEAVLKKEDNNVE